MIVCERITFAAKNGFETRSTNWFETSSYNGSETRSYLLALAIALFKTGPQNRVRAATFAAQRRSLSGFKTDPTVFQIYIPPFNRFVFIFLFL